MSTSRSTRRPTPRRTSRVLLGATAIGTATVLLTACGSGQVGTIGSQVAAVNGAQGVAGQVAVRNVSVQFPSDGTGFYSTGGRAPLLFTIANVGVGADQLVSVSTPAAATVSLQGATAIPGGTALVSSAVKAFSQLSPTTVMPAPSGSTTRTPPTSAGSPSAAGTSVPNPSGGAGLPGTTVGVVKAELTGLTQDVRPGLTIQITFTFAKAGPVTLPVPMDAPTDNAPDPVPGAGY